MYKGIIQLKLVKKVIGVVKCIVIGDFYDLEFYKRILVVEIQLKGVVVIG